MQLFFMCDSLLHFVAFRCVCELNSSIADITSWNAPTSEINSLAKFGQYIDGLTTRGFRYGYIGASVATNIGLTSSGHTYFLLSNSNSYKTVLSINASTGVVKTLVKINGNWASSWVSV